MTIKKEDLKKIAKIIVIQGAIGAVIGIIASFAALSPLIIGGIVGCTFPVLRLTWYTGKLLHALCKENKIKEDDDKDNAIGWCTTAFLSAIIGVGLGAAADALFLGVMLGMESAALAGAVIGAITLVAALLVSIPITDKIVKWISSRENQLKPNTPREGDAAGRDDGDKPPSGFSNGTNATSAGTANYQEV